MNGSTKLKRCYIVSPYDQFLVLGQGDVQWSTLDGNYAVKMDDTFLVEMFPSEMVTMWDDIGDIAPYLIQERTA